MKHLSLCGTALLVLCLSLNTVAAHAKVVTSGDNGFNITIDQTANGNAQTLYQTFVNDVGDWWLDSHTWFGDAGRLTIDAVAGGCFCERNGEQQALHMTVGFVEPNKTLRLLGGLGPLQELGMHGAMTITFSDQQVSLNYTAVGYPITDFKQLAPIVDNVLQQQLASFATSLD